MIVVDASAALSALLNDGPARATLVRERLHAPHLIDPEVTNAVRRRVGANQLSAEQGWATVAVLRQLGMSRHPTYPLLHRVWQLRDNLSAYDASYVALAEALGCTLVTADARITRATGLGCALTLVPW